MGFETVGDIARHDPEALVRRLGPSGRALWEQANAIDPRPVIPDRDAKSIGAEDTFDEDLSGVEALAPRIHAQALRVARRLRHAGLRARTVQLKLKRADFTLVTRRATLDEATDDGQLLYREAAALLAREPARPTRLTGVSAQNLVAAAAPQLGLFAPPPTTAQALNRALDAIADRFGAGSVTTADVADDDSDLERLPYPIPSPQAERGQIDPPQRERVRVRGPASRAKRATENGARSIADRPVATSSAIASAVIGASRMPLRKWPVASTRPRTGVAPSTGRWSSV